MLALIYGLQKSASSFAFRLTQEALRQAGHDQKEFERLLKRLNRTHGDFVRRAGTVRTNGHAFAELVEGSRTSLYAAKTHGPLLPNIRAYLESSSIRAIALTRDPYDAALSLYEHAERDRQNREEKRRSFRHVATLRDAIDHIALMLPRSLDWRAHPDVLHIEYECLTRRTEEALGKITAKLGVEVDPQPVMDAIYERGIPLFNKGRSGRFEELAGQDDKAYAQEAFTRAGYRSP